MQALQNSALVSPEHMTHGALHMLDLKHSGHKKQSVEKLGLT